MEENKTSRGFLVTAVVLGVMATVPVVCLFAEYPFGWQGSGTENRDCRGQS